jgi:hypothetical protein
MQTYIRISGTFFCIVALMHALRLLQGWPVEVAGWTVPTWISAIGVLVPGMLSIWAFRIAGKAQG